MKDKECGDNGYGERGNVLISILDDLPMAVSCSHPAGQTARKKASEQEVAAAAVRDKRMRNDHAHGGKPGYTFVPFSIESYRRLGVEADKLP